MAVEYRIEAGRIKEVEVLVNEALAEGWSLHGTLALAEGATGHLTCAQVLVRERVVPPAEG